MLLALAGGFAGLCLNPSILVSPEKTWWNGEWGVAYEDRLDEEYAIHDPSVDAWGVVEFLAFGSGRPGVVVGRDGWLFTGEEFELYPGAAERAVERAGRVAEVQAVARARGVELVVAYLPAKSRVEVKNLGHHVVPASVAAVGPSFLRELSAAGVEVVDLEGPLAAARSTGEVFLRTDTHWSPRGAEVSARAVAERVRDAGADWLDSASVVVTPGSPLPHEGDLLRYLPLGPFQRSLGPPLDELRTPGVAVEAGGGLLGEATIPVALVGTSYSEDRRWGFVGALQAALGADVLNAATQGRGPFAAMDSYLANEAWSQSPPRLLVWEIPERYVGMPDADTTPLTD